MLSAKYQVPSYTGASMKFSPTLAGWRMISRDPAIALAEITWRWVFGLVAGLVMVFSVLVYLSTIPVPAPALWLMDTRRAALIAGTVAQLVHGSLWAATKLTLIGVPALAVFWIVLASLGRTATIQAMLSSGPQCRARWQHMVPISFLRFATWFAANVALYGALVLAAMATTGLKHPVGTALLIFFALTIVILSAWSMLNWLLTLASIYVIRDDEETFSAISSAVDLLRRRFGPLLATSSAWAIVRSIALGAAIFLNLIALALLRRVPPGYVLVAIFVVTLAYLAFADFIYVGRLASYVAIVEADLEPSPPDVLPVPVTPEPSSPPPILPFSPELPAGS